MSWMGLRRWIEPVGFGTILYFANSGLPHWSLLIPLSVYFFRWLREPRVQRGDDLLLLFIAGGLCVVCFSFEFIEAKNRLQPFLLPLLFLCAVAGRSLSRRVLVVLLAWTSIEVFLTFAQAALSGNSTQFGLYEIRPVGFSTPGRVGERIFLGLLTLVMLKDSIDRRWFAGLFFLFLSASIVNLTRSIYPSLVPLAVWLWLSRPGVRKRFLNRWAALAGVLLSILILVFHQWLFMTLFRREDFSWTIVLSGRERLWASAWLLFEESPLIGLGGSRFESWVSSLVAGLPNNVHNSFLSVLVSYGLCGFILFISVVTRINRKNAGLLLSMLVFSFFNFMIFWNVSLADILLYRFADPLEKDD